MDVQRGFGGRGGYRGGQGAGKGYMRGFRGPEGECVCPRCGYRVPHQRGVPCRMLKCPKCGTPMTRLV